MLVKEKKITKKTTEAQRKIASARRGCAERRKNISHTLSILDRRNIEDRRTVKDRRISKIKPQFSPITEQGVTVSGLISEQKKAIEFIIDLRDSIQSKGHVEIMNALKDLCFAFDSQLSKEKILYQWYDEATKKNQVLGDEVPALILNLYFLLHYDLKNIIDTFDKYLNLKVDIHNNLNAFHKEVDEISETLEECLALKVKYLYPQYKEYLMI